MVQRIIRVYGKVQGVYFRESTKTKALELGITGYVKNESDGSVLIVVEGEEDLLNKLESWSRVGPPTARVDSILTDQKNEIKGYTTFTVDR